MNQPMYTPMATKEDSMNAFIKTLHELFDDDCIVVLVAYHPNNNDVSVQANVNPKQQRDLLEEALHVIPREN